MKIEKNTTDDGDIISFKFLLCFFIVINSQTRTNNRIYFHSDKHYVIVAGGKVIGKIDFNQTPRGLLCCVVLA
jgi:hypothetical protein